MSTISLDDSLHTLLPELIERWNGGDRSHPQVRPFERGLPRKFDSDLRR